MPSCSWNVFDDLTTFFLLCNDSSASGRRVGSSEKLARPAQGSPAFWPTYLHLGCTEDFPGGFKPDDYSSSAAPVATGRTDNSPGGTLHPLAFETQEVSP